MTILSEANRSEPAQVTQTTQSPGTIESSQLSEASKSTQNEHVEGKNEECPVDLTSDTTMTQRNESKKPSNGPKETLVSKKPDQNVTAHESKSKPTQEEKPKAKNHIVSADGVSRTEWYDPQEEDEEENEKEDSKMEDVNKEEDTAMKDSTSTVDADKAPELEEGEIDEFAQFNDMDYAGIDTEAFAKGKAPEGSPLYSSHPTTETPKTEAELRKEKMQQETKTYMQMQPLKRDLTKPTNIWVHVDVPDGNIEKVKTTMWHDVIKEMFEADPEVKILPRNLKSTSKPLSAGDAKLPPLLFPDYITPPKINKTFEHGAVRYEFSFRIRQGIYIYRDLKKTTPVKNVMKWYNMSWISSEIYGSSRTRMGFIWGKDPDFAHTANFGAWLRMKVPRETPPFDLRVEPQTYHYGSAQERALVIKLFAASEDTEQVIAGVMTVLGDMNSIIFFVPRVLSDELQAKLLHQHTANQRRMKRMDVPSHHLDRPMTINGQLSTIRDYVLNLKDPTGASCRLDIEKIVSKQRQGRRRPFMPTVLMIPHDCPSPNWSAKHVQAVLERLAYPGQAKSDPFCQAHQIPQEMADNFKIRAGQVPAPKVNYRGATAKQFQEPTITAPTTWAEKVRAGNNARKKAAQSHPPANDVATFKAPMDNMTARLEAMAKEQNAMKVRATNTGITVKAHADAMESLKKSMQDQEESLQQTDKNVGQVFNILEESQKTQRAFQQKIDTLTGLSVMMYRVLRKQFPKNSGLGEGYDPLIEALAADLRGGSVTTNLEDRFSAEDEAAAMEINDDERTVATAVEGASDDEYVDELEDIESQLAKVTEEAAALKQAQRELEEGWTGVPVSPKRSTRSSSKTPRRSTTGVRSQRSPGHNRYAELASSNKKKRGESTSDDEDSSGV